MYLFSTDEVDERLGNNCLTERTLIFIKLSYYILNANMKPSHVISPWIIFLFTICFIILTQRTEISVRQEPLDSAINPPFVPALIDCPNFHETKNCILPPFLTFYQPLCFSGCRLLSNDPSTIIRPLSVDPDCRHYNVFSYPKIVENLQKIWLLYYCIIQ